MSRRQHNGVAEPVVEVKLEPLIEDCTEEENDGGFAGFANVSSVPCAADEEALDLWTSRATACLISRYKKYHSMVGQSAGFKSRREMFENISLEMQKFGYRFSSRKCENKWRVLERKYKNLLLRERLKKPGRMKHYRYWEHRGALDEIFDQERRYAYPEENFLSAGSPNVGARDTAVESDDRSKDDRGEDTLENGAQSAEKFGRTSDEGTVVLQNLLAEVNKSLALAETNRERRHREKMAMRQAELDVHRKLLKLKEQKMELCKSQMTSAAQSIRLMK